MNGWIAQINILCFAASYGITFLLEISRLAFRSGVRGAVMILFAAGGLFAHTLFLAHRAYIATGVPLSSPFDWYLIAAWLLILVYLYLTVYHQHTAMGFFVLPFVGVLILAAQWADKQPFASR
ncbi:MAG: hypothetical protein N2C14_30880, partial [Planctomycetales bacterium]